MLSPRHPGPLNETTWRDLKPVLDAEIDRLPEKYRAGVILCYLEGHSTAEATALLGCPKGTVYAQRVRRRKARRVLECGARAPLSFQTGAPPVFQSSPLQVSCPGSPGPGMV